MEISKVKQKRQGELPISFDYFLLVCIAVYSVLYFICVVSAFYAAGMHLEDPSAIRAKLFGLSSYPYHQFAATLGIVLSYAMGLFAGFIIFAGLVTAISWTFYCLRMKILMLIGIAIGIMTVAFAISPLGNLISFWIAD
jgi:hypothetical protein